MSGGGARLIRAWFYFILFIFSLFNNNDDNNFKHVTASGIEKGNLEDGILLLDSSITTPSKMKATDETNRSTTKPKKKKKKIHRVDMGMEPWNTFHNSLLLSFVFASVCQVSIDVHRLVPLELEYFFTVSWI